MYHPATTPSQYLHPRTPNPYRIHCGRWKHEQDREAYSRSAVTNLVLAGAPIVIFSSATYARRTKAFYSTIMRSFNWTDLPRKLHDRFPPDPLTDLRWSELSFGRSSFAIAHVPAQLLHHHHPPIGRAKLEQLTLLDVKVAGLPIFSTPPPPKRFDGKRSRMSAKCRWIKKHPLWCDRCGCGGRRIRRRLVKSRIPMSFSYLERFLFFGTELLVEDAICICDRGDGIHAKSCDASWCAETDNGLLEKLKWKTVRNGAEPETQDSKFGDQSETCHFPPLNSSPKSTGSSLEALPQETRVSAGAEVKTVAQLCHYNTKLTPVQDTCFFRRAPIHPKNGSIGSSMKSLFQHCQKPRAIATFADESPAFQGRSAHWGKVCPGPCVDLTSFPRCSD